MSLDVERLRSSFALVIERDPDIAERFYTLLFERYPQLEPLFISNSPSVQQRMLAEALGAVMDHLDNSEWLAETLGRMGARHRGYGATPETYDWVGECLLDTLAEVAGDDWTHELSSAWGDAYEAIVSLMLAGAQSPVPS